MAIQQAEIDDIDDIDDIGITLSHADDITAYEAKRPAWLA